MIIDKPILGIPIKSKTLKIPSIRNPSNLEIGPKIAPSSCVNKIPDNFVSSIINIKEQGHTLPLKMGYILIFSKQQANRL